MKNLSINQFRKMALCLGIMAFLATISSACAATIEMYVYVKGYGNNLILVKPNSQLGGRVIWDASSGGYITDRVQRGETMLIIAWATTGESLAPNGAAFGIWCAAKNRYIVGLNSETLSFDLNYVVSTDPSNDNLYVDVYSNLGLKSKRIPIGSR